MLLGLVFYWLVKIHKRHSAASNEVSHSVASYRSLYCVSMYSNGVARTLKNYAHQRETTGSINDFL